MAMAINPILALLLALSMLLSPAVSSPAEVPEMTITVTRADGQTISGGFVKTTDDLPAFMMNILEQSLLINGEASYYSDGTASYTVSSNDLMGLLNAMMPSIPEPTQNDLNAVMLLLQGIASGISSDSFTLTPMGNGVSISYNLDALARDLHTAVPNALNTYAAFIDPTLAKYSQPLLGQTITCAQLASMWSQLNLDEIQPGLWGTLSVLPGRDSISIVGSLCDLSFVANIRETSFDCSITAPDGKQYVLDTNDIAVVAKILSNIPSVMTNTGFNVTETEDTLKVTVDLAALANDLNRAMTFAIALNSAEVDALLNKYRTWFELIDADFAAQLTAANLSKAFQQGVFQLPALKGELTVQQDAETRTYNVNGYFANCTLTGKFHSRSNDGSFLFAVNDRYEPLYLTLDIATDYNTTSFSLNSSMPVFDLFNTVTLYVKDSYYPQYTLTTDTNVLRLGFNSDEQYLEAKIGELNLSYKMDEEEANHFELYTKDFFARLLATEDHIALDSTVFGFDYAENRSGVTIDGYIYEDLDPDYDRYEFGLYFNERSLLSAYLSDGRYENYALTVGNQVATFSNGYDTYTVTPYYGAEKEAYVVAKNGEAQCSIAGDVNDDGNEVTVYYYQGLDMTATPAFTIVLDMTPDKVAVPADATTVDAQTFITKLASLFE